MTEGDATRIRVLAVGLRTWEDVGDIRICAHTERGTPFFSDNFRETGDTCFGQTIIGLTSIAIDATGAANIDDVPRLPIFDSEIGRSGSHELERRSVVEGNDGVPLLVCHLPKPAFSHVCSSTAHTGSIETSHTLCMTPSHVNPALLTMI